MPRLHADRLPLHCPGLVGTGAGHTDGLLAHVSDMDNVKL